VNEEEELLLCMNVSLLVSDSGSFSPLTLFGTSARISSINSSAMNNNNNNNGNDQADPSNTMSNMNGEVKKMNLVLDFNGNSSQRQKFYFNGAPAATPACLDSTDMLKFGMTTPDVEQFLQQHLIHSMEQQRPELRVKSEESESSERRATSPVDDVRQELKALNVDPGARLNPIDMHDQEAIKLERKRQRNRIAASKCRKRKLEKIARLEDKVRHIKGENGELVVAVSRLRDHVMSLKQDLIDHVKHGCVVAGFSI
jgi:hypothetical protein